jgi:CRISPR-associated protein Cmr2
MAANKHFHFTIGPVQGFVAQARRTRDFWAGSFLLSWLSGIAMAEVQRQNGKIDFPVPPDGYLGWITTGKGAGNGPRQGAIPNRFKAMQAEVPADFDGARVASCVREAWVKLAEHVWKSDNLDDVASPLTREIWDRQNKGFWDISWIIADDESDSSLMDQRKNWRSHHAKQGEPGVKCMVMEGWQELSGSTHPGREGKAFWQKASKGKLTDLREGEQLCALAYVKRRFVRHFSSFNATLTSGLTVSGWQLDIGMPSVSYMAAVHWLEQLVKSASEDEIRPLLEAARDVDAARDEWDTSIACLKNAVGHWSSGSHKRQLLSLDGSLFFDHVQDNPAAYGYDAAKVSVLKRELVKFRDRLPERAAAPSPFYAILMMDGDSLGSHMADKSKQQAISRALEKFTSAVPECVEQHNGYLIYAGGDDVLAMLPLEDAMRCAAAVRVLYLDSFKESKIPTTISAAIEYAHVKMPLGKVLSDLHDLLDKVAKDGAGRDALAVRVWKPGGMVLQWVQPWEIALQDGKLQIEQLVAQFRGKDKSEPSESGASFSGKFFFKIAERFDLLNPSNEQSTPVLTEDNAISLLAADFVNSADNRDKITIEEARTAIAPLLQQCRAVIRKLDMPAANWPHSKMLKADGALLVRFLAQKGLNQ